MLPKTKELFFSKNFVGNFSDWTLKIVLIENRSLKKKNKTQPTLEQYNSSQREDASW